jgi:hypothetical protein
MDKSSKPFSKNPHHIRSLIVLDGEIVLRICDISLFISKSKNLDKNTKIDHVSWHPTLVVPLEGSYNMS